jgi:hypothetical protein
MHSDLLIRALAKEPPKVMAHKAVWADGAWWVHDNTGVVVAVWANLPSQAGLYLSVADHPADNLVLVDYRPGVVAVIK